MKYIFSLILCVCILSVSFSQETMKSNVTSSAIQEFPEELLETLASDACACLKNSKLEGLNRSQIEMQMGICLLQSVSNNKNEIEKKTGITTIQPSDLKGFGEMVGMKMAFICPEIFMFFIDEGEYGSEEEIWNVSVELGKIKSIEKKQFNIVNLEMADDSILKFIWLWDFEGSEILMKNQFSNKWVNVFYSTLELYDPEKKKYIPFRVIEGIELGE